MFTLSNVALGATALSAVAFAIVALMAFDEGKWLLVGLYAGLATANGSLAILASQA